MAGKLYEPKGRIERANMIKPTWYVGGVEDVAKI